MNYKNNLEIILMFSYLFRWQEGEIFLEINI